MQTKAEKQFQENCWQLCSKELSNFSFHSFVLLAFFSQNSYHRYQTFQTQHFEHRHFVPNEIKLFQQNNGLCAEYNPNILRGLGGGGLGGGALAKSISQLQLSLLKSESIIYKISKC